MAKLKKLYIVKDIKNNRKDRRAFQRELDHINKNVLPIFAAFEETYETATESDRQKANAYYIDTCRIINYNKKYVEANPNAFILNTTSIEEEVLSEVVDNRKKNISYYIIAIILLIIILCFLF